MKRGRDRTRTASECTLHSHIVEGAWYIVCFGPRGVCGLGARMASMDGSCTWTKETLEYDRRCCIFAHRISLLCRRIASWHVYLAQMHLPNHKKDCVLIRKRGRQAMSVQGTSDWLTQHQIDDRLAAEARKPNSVLYFAAQNFEATYILEDNLKRKVNQLRKQYKEGKRVFTLVYNLSASNLTGKVDGSHWVCAVYDMRTATPRMQTKIQYFDSFGNKPPVIL